MYRDIRQLDLGLGPVLSITRHLLHPVQRIQPVDDMPKDGVLAVEAGVCLVRDEKLENELQRGARASDKKSKGSSE